MEEVQMAIETECANCNQIAQCYDDGEAYVCVSAEMCKKNVHIAALEAELAAARAAGHIERLEAECSGWERQTRSLADALVAGLAERNALTAELALARAVVERAREWRKGGLYDPRLDDALAAYDAARRQSSM